MNRWRGVSNAVLIFVVLVVFSALLAQSNDEAYGKKIREYTTDDMYLNEMVDHLPASDNVPSPLDHFGEIIGAPGILHYSDEIYGYHRALADASPRVTIRTIGKTEEGREMLEIIVADENTQIDLKTYVEYLNKLADPRLLADSTAQELIDKAKPIYYITAGLHSPETGPPEMMMELAYRLAVGESEMVRTIRENVILVFVPVTEVDGRDRMVDIYNYRKAHKDVGPGLLYWGHYVAHDNNRDGFGLSLALTRNTLASFLEWKPTIWHDLHESVPYLYVSTGTGPYNEYIDAITIAEWHNLAHEEVTQLTRRGMPGVWTHGFYNGWAANYLMWIANTRNATGRFYETFGNSIADTKERKLQKRNTSVKWYRPNPPLEKTMWSLRNNTNYMQSGVLVALKYTADYRRQFVENFYLKTRNAIEKGKEEPPYAWIIPRQQRRHLAAADFINLLLQQGLEIHQAEEDLVWTAGKEKAAGSSNGAADSLKERKIQTAQRGDYIIRMDQPYRTLARVLLDKQNFPEDERPPYDDTGWALPLLRQVQTYRVNDPEIYNAAMKPVTEPVQVAGQVQGNAGDYYVINNTTDHQLAVVRFRLANIKMHAAEAAFEIDSVKYAAGSLLIPARDNPANLGNRLEKTARELGVMIAGVSKKPDVAMHELEIPRVALVHTWVSTPQDAGWWRYAFDTIGVPYTHLSEQDLATSDLSQFNVIIMPRTRASSQRLVAGITTVGDPLPWKNSKTFKHIGMIDETEDTRKGMGYEGVGNLKAFIENGGVFITEGTTAAFPIDMAITRNISIKETKNLLARGSVLKAVVTDTTSPIVYGFTDTLAVYFSQAPVFQIDQDLFDFRMPDWYKDELWSKEVPRVVMGFPKKQILLSGMLREENELAGAPVVVDVPVGEGHVVLFANRPFWRWETHGSHALVLNTILHWNDLRVGWPERKEEDEEARSASHHEEGWWEMH